MQLSSYMNLLLDIKELKKQLKKSNDPKVIDQLKKRISWIVSTCFVWLNLDRILFQSDHVLFV